MQPLSIKKMKTILPFLFLLQLACQAQSDQLIPYRIKNKWGYSNTKGEIIIPVKFSHATLFQDTLALVRKGGKFFFINPQGKNSFKKKFSYAEPFVSGFAKVTSSRKTFYINQKGMQATTTHTPYGNDSSPIPDNEIMIKQNNLYGYKFMPFSIGTPRDTLHIPAIYDTIIPNNKKRIAIAKKSAKWGVVNYQNQTIIPFEYDTIQQQNNLFILTRNQTDAIADQTGNVIIPHGQYKILKIENNHLFKILLIDNQKEGYISSNGIQYFR